MTSVRHVAVIVPARDEQSHIAACLHSVSAAVEVLRHDHPKVSCDVVVVLDRCADDTGELACAAGARTIDCAVGRVGAARHMGATDAVSRARRSGFTPNTVWLANTDADTTVPPSWLATQLRFADSGCDAVIGTVTPGGLDPRTERRWQQRHHLVEGHGHVHGANLGLRASTYLTVGGFAPVSLHEDLDLVHRVKARTRRWVATHQTNVTTSARALSRVEGGFASYLAELGQEDTSCA